MANPAKAKGTTWETTVVSYLRESGIPANRTGSADAASGDIHAGDWTIEAKAEARIDLPGYLKQLAAAAVAAKRPPYKSAVVVKNRRHSAGEAYAVMSAENYRGLMVYVMSMEATLEDVLSVYVQVDREAGHE